MTAIRKNDTWTDARIARLTELWNDGKSASQIAEIMNRETGENFSRSSMIGKAHRAGLVERMNGGATSGAYSLEQVQNARSCLWPSGHRPTMTFCGAREPASDSYCEFHRSIASTPTARQAQEHR